MSQTQPGMTRVTVGVTTTGPDIDALVFRVTIVPEGTSGSVKAHAGIFSTGNVPPGEHLVRLTDLPPRCAVQGPSERSITSSIRRPVLVRYEVVCR
jgi:hypothetical protein